MQVEKRWPKVQRARAPLLVADETPTVATEKKEPQKATHSKFVWKLLRKLCNMRCLPGFGYGLTFLFLVCSLLVHWTPTQLNLLIIFLIVVSSFRRAPYAMSRKSWVWFQCITWTSATQRPHLAWAASGEPSRCMAQRVAFFAPLWAMLAAARNCQRTVKCKHCSTSIGLTRNISPTLLSSYVYLSLASC